MSISHNIQSTCNICIEKLPAIRHTTVLILGGGMAGVAAAHTLQSLGMEDFLLLEASERLGGRISNTKFCGHTIEDGANWIHGVGDSNNPIFLLARECGLKLYHNTFDSFSARDSNGRDITEEVVEEVEALENAVSLAFETANKRGVAGGEPPPDGHLNSDGPLPDCSMRVAERDLAGWKASSAAQVASNWCVHDWTDALPSNESSLLGCLNDKNDELYNEEDALVVDEEGYAKLVRHLAAQAFVGGAHDARLLLHETVCEVHLLAADGECSNCHSARTNTNEREGVYVRTAEGHEYCARYCIVTFSSAVLLSGKVQFFPSLPEWKLRSLRQSELAACTKIFVKFADDVRPFWDQTEWILFVDSEPVDSSLSSDTNDQYIRLRNSSASMRQALKCGDRFTSGFYSGWSNLALDGILPGSNILLILLMGEMAKSAELKSDEELKAEITAVLRRMYGKNIPEPQAIHCTKWNSNPLTLGSFHCLRYGCTLNDLESLSRPVNTLHFAGDGTTLKFTGCVNGAYNTGVRQARAVFEKINGPEDKRINY